MIKPAGYYVWPTIIVGFLGFIVALNTYLFYLATDSHSRSRLLEDSPYEKGLEYQTTVDALEIFKQLGWRASSSFDSSAGIINFSVRDSKDLPVSGAQVILRAIRPDSETFDQHLELLESPSSPGLYSSGFARGAGSWLLRYRIKIDDLTVGFEERVMF